MRSARPFCFPGGRISGDIEIRRLCDSGSEPARRGVDRAKGVAALAGVSVATVYRWVAAGYLPPPRRIGPNVSGWLSSEIDEWLRSRPLEGCIPPEKAEALKAAREKAAEDASQNRKAVA